MGSYERARSSDAAICEVIGKERAEAAQAAVEAIDALSSGWLSTGCAPCPRCFAAIYILAHSLATLHRTTISVPRPQRRRTAITLQPRGSLGDPRLCLAT